MSSTHNEEIEQLSDKLTSEIRRGSLVLAVLGQLREEHYGYSLRKALGSHGIDVEEGTLYPLVRRLESQGLLSSEWRDDGARRKRFYRLSPVGEAVLTRLLGTWDELHAGVQSIIQKSAEDTDHATP